MNGRMNTRFDRLLPAVALLVLAVVLLSGRGAAAQVTAPAPAGPEPQRMYEWKDDQGVPHVTNSLQNVPPQHRSTVNVKEFPSAPEGQGTAAPEAATAPLRGREESTADRDEQLRRVWQQRMRQARQKVTVYEEQLRGKEQELQKLKDAWGDGLYGYTDTVSAQIKQLEDQIQTLKERLASARKAVDEDLQEEARKAGVPPGYLRE